jgi:RNA ligase (TIGR02306 family)
VSTLPTHLSKYDIEDATRYYESLSSYFDEGFVMTLKLEGSNFCVGYHPDEDPERRVYVCSRNQQLRRDPEIPREKQHFFLTCAENIGIEAKIAAWAEQNAPHEPVTLYGELLGPNVQKNFYNLSQHHVIFFDLKIGNRWVDYRDFRRICLEELKVNIAPELINLDDPLGESLSETLKSQSLIELSRVVGPQISPGPEPLSLVMRPKVKFHEGVVIKPRCEHYTPRGQRVILKKRCPDYLERSGL